LARCVSHGQYEGSDPIKRFGSHIFECVFCGMDE
jgi:hypothetical protein